MAGKSSLSGWFASLPPVVRAALWMTFSAFSYAASIAIVHHLARDLHFMQVAFLRNIFGFLFMMPWLIKAGLGALKTSRPHMHALRGILSAMNVWFLFAALSLAPLADTAAITFMMPIVGSIFAVLILKEKTSFIQWIAIAAGFGGALMVIRPGMEGFNPGLLYAVCSVLAGATVAILIKSLLAYDSADTIVFYLFVSHIVFSLGPALWYWQTPTLYQLGWCVALGYLATLIQRCFNRSMAIADASVVLPFNFTRLVWAALFGWLFFAEFPDLWTWIGGSVIFAASVWLTRITSQKKNA